MKNQFVASAFIFCKFMDEYKVLVLNHKKLNKWVIPGGHIEDDENPLQAIVREVYEETHIENLDIVTFKNNDKPTNLIDSTQLLSPEWMSEEIIPSSKSVPQHIHIDMFYIMMVSDSYCELNKNESNSIKWVTENELDCLDAFFSTKYFSKKIFKMLTSISPNTIYRIRNNMHTIEYCD